MAMGAREPALVPALVTAITHPDSIPLDEVPGVLDELEHVKARLSARLRGEQGTPRKPPGSSADRVSKLLDAGEVAERLGVTERWVYRHAPRLPFTKRLSRRVLRFSEPGLRRWLERQDR